MSSNRPPPDWKRTGTVVGYADYLRKQSDAICVLVIRPHDSVLSVDERCSPEDAERLVLEYAPQLVSREKFARAEERKKKQAARLELERVPE
jgi:cysteine synthase